ncbi:hypothetical protein FXO38_03527 [Capsicum annuum]|nr:hypothetical protein FXO38_03527 [Capsicum annuum]
MLNSDATFKPDSGRATIAGIFRNHNGAWLLGFTEHISTTSPLEAEIHALMLGLSIVRQYQLNSLKINVDWENIIYFNHFDAFNEGKKFHHVIGGVMEASAEAHYPALVGRPNYPTYSTFPEIPKAETISVEFESVEKVGMVLLVVENVRVSIVPDGPEAEGNDIITIQPSLPNPIEVQLKAIPKGLSNMIVNTLTRENIISDDVPDELIRINSRIRNDGACKALDNVIGDDNRKLGFEVIQNKLKVPIARFLVENGENHIFTKGGKIVLASKWGRGERLLSGEEVRVEIEDDSFDIIRGMTPVPIVILNGSNPISSPFVNGGGMEESSVRVSLSGLVYSRFHSPKFLLTSEDVAKVSLKGSC